MKAMLLAAVLVAATVNAADESPAPPLAAEELAAMFEEGRTGEAVETIMAMEGSERLDGFDMAREVWVFARWEGKELDDYLVIAGAGIEEAMRQAREATDSAEIGSPVDRANVMSYNLTADLAECWPGDTLARHQRHFERGLAAALQCVEWRLELEKGSYPLYIAYWAAGMHQLSLGRDEQALYTLNQALNQAQQHTVDSGLPLGLAPRQNST